MFGSFRSKKKAAKAKVLIVDDEPQILATLKPRIEKEGYDVLTACDGKDGLDKAIRHKPDLILLDILMPIMDGLEMLEHLRKHPECDNIAIIMLTARNSMNDVGRSALCGIDDYIVKPFNIVELLAKIEKICNAPDGASGKRIAISISH